MKYLCLFLQISRASGNQDANELDTYVNVYTQLLSEKIEAHWFDIWLYEQIFLDFLKSVLLHIFSWLFVYTHHYNVVMYV